MTDSAMPEPRLYKRLKWAGGLLILGLLVEVATLYLGHPLAFVAYLVIGASLVAAGILLYLWSIVSATG